MSHRGIEVTLEVPIEPPNRIFQIFFFFEI
jgi:hypothetical protein